MYKAITVSAINRSTSSCCVFAFLLASLARICIYHRQLHASHFMTWIKYTALSIQGVDYTKVTITYLCQVQYHICVLSWLSSELQICNSRFIEQWSKRSRNFQELSRTLLVLSAALSFKTELKHFQSFLKHTKILTT